MSYLNIAKQTEARNGRKATMKPDPYKIARDYFTKCEILKTEPAPYLLDEILALRNRSPEELQEIHKAKLAYSGQRIIQEGPEG